MSVPAQPLPEIKRRVHAQARRLKLTLRRGEVWLTCPPRVSELAIQRFLTQSKPWLEQAWQAYLDGLPVAESTDVVDVPMLGQTWQIQPDASCQMAYTASQRLYVPQQDWPQQVKDWIKQHANTHLPRRLQQLSQQHGFDYGRCTVRQVVSRWGSCSAQKNISLNAALLLLPVELVDYVLLHELCHTRQMNHSAAFWGEMTAVCTDWPARRQTLKSVQLPTWWGT